jgi:hypothetical protein
MYSRKLLMAFTVLTALGSGGMATAQTATPPAAQALQAEGQGVALPAKSATAVDQLHLADQLFALGVKNEDALLVLAAARLYAANPSQVLDKPPTAAPGEPAPSPAADQSRPELAQVLQVARTLAAGDAALLAQANGIETRQARGLVGGAKRTVRYVVNPGRIHRFVEIFRGGELGVVTLDGDGDGLLNLVIRDPVDDSVVCYARLAGDQQRCSFNVYRTTEVVVEVQNVGGYASGYRMRMN